MERGATGTKAEEDEAPPGVTGVTGVDESESVSTPAAAAAPAALPASNAAWNLAMSSGLGESGCLAGGIAEKVRAITGGGAGEEEALGDGEST